MNGLVEHLKNCDERKRRQSMRTMTQRAFVALAMVTTAVHTIGYVGRNTYGQTNENAIGASSPKVNIVEAEC